MTRKKDYLITDHQYILIPLLISLLGVGESFRALKLLSLGTYDTVVISHVTKSEHSGGWRLPVKSHVGYLIDSENLDYPVFTSRTDDFYPKELDSLKVFHSSTLRYAVYFEGEITALKVLSSVGAGMSLFVLIGFINFAFCIYVGLEKAFSESMYVLTKYGTNKENDSKFVFQLKLANILLTIVASLIALLTAIIFFVNFTLNITSFNNLIPGICFVLGCIMISDLPQWVVVIFSEFRIGSKEVFKIIRNFSALLISLLFIFKCIKFYLINNNAAYDSIKSFLKSVGEFLLF